MININNLLDYLKFDRLLRGANSALSNASIGFYQSNSNDKQVVFTSIQHKEDILSNPVIADANGIFPNIHLESGEYRVEIKNQAQTTIFQEVGIYTGEK